ncbi:MAG TPA: hypothetical protein VJS92_17745, partial [Candidatus Polarisedimenticolaceae bacterium]|nr:hypothetical protein [Candidatus Polarisedimenticolaceae bacterium]
RRVLELPGDRAHADALLEEARFWSQVHGVGLHHWSERAADAATSLGRVVLGLLLEEEAEPAAIPGLPLQRIGPLTVWDDAASCSSSPPDPRRTARDAASIAGFLLGCSLRRTRVFQVDAASEPPPLIAAVRRSLLRRTRRNAGPHPGRGGLLLLVRPPATGRDSPSPA